MTNYFLGLAQRTLGFRETLQPSIASMFEPGMLLMDDYVPTEAMESEAMTVEPLPIAEPQYSQATMFPAQGDLPAQSPISKINPQFFFRAAQPQLNEASLNVPFGIEQGEARSFADSITIRAGERLDPVQQSEFRSLHWLPNSTPDRKLEQNILQGKLNTHHSSRSRFNPIRSDSQLEVTGDAQKLGKTVAEWQIRSESSHEPFVDFAPESQVPAELNLGLDQRGVSLRSSHQPFVNFTRESRIPDQWYSRVNEQSTVLHTNSSPIEQSVGANPYFTFDKQSHSDAESIHREIDGENLTSIDSGSKVLNPAIAQQSNYSSLSRPLSRNTVLQTQNDRRFVFDSLRRSESSIASAVEFRDNKNSQPFHTVPISGVANGLSHNRSVTAPTLQPIQPLVQQRIESMSEAPSVPSIVDGSSTTFNSLLTQPRLESRLPIQRSPKVTDIRACSPVQPQPHMGRVAAILPSAEIKSATELEFLRESSALTLSLFPREREQETSSSLLPQGEGLGMRAARIPEKGLLTEPSHSVDTLAELKQAIGLTSSKRLQLSFSPFDEVALPDRNPKSQKDKIAAESFEAHSNDNSHSSSQIVPLINSDRLTPASSLSCTGAISQALNSKTPHRDHTIVLNPSTNHNIVPLTDKAVSDTADSWAVLQNSNLLPTSQQQLSFFSDTIVPLQTAHPATLPIVQHQFRAFEDSVDKVIQELGSYESSASLNSQIVEPGVTVNSSVLDRQNSQPENINQSTQLGARVVRQGEALSNASLIGAAALRKQAKEINYSLSEQDWNEITSDTVKLEPSPHNSRFAAPQFSPALVKRNTTIAQSDTTQAQQYPIAQSDQSIPTDSQAQILVQSSELSRDRTVSTNQETEFFDRVSHQKPNAPLSLQETEAELSQNRKKPAFSDPAPRPPMPRAIAYFRPSLKLDDYLKRRQGGRS